MYSDKIKFGIQVQFIVENIDKLKKLHLSLSDSEHKKILVKSKDRRSFSFFFKDSSIEDEQRFDSFGVEIKTIPLEYTKKNMDKMLGLLNLLEEHSYTNNTCSIHIHSSIKGYSIKDNYKILYDYLKYKMDKDLLTYNNVVQFHNECYANYSRCRKFYLYSINSAIRNNKKAKFKPNKEFKCFLYQVRGQKLKTIQYRGLRGHFSEVDNETIIDYFEKYLNNIAYCVQNPSDTNLDNIIEMDLQSFL